MKRWAKADMLQFAQHHFAQYYQARRLSHENNDIHFLQRDKLWLEKGIDQIIQGDYSPGCIERYYFGNNRGCCDNVPIKDRVLQRVIYEELKPTLKKIMSTHCYHLQGPEGVRKVSHHIREKLEENKYFIRTDIKSYFNSINHALLIKNIENHYDDPRLVKLLTQIIKTPINTPNGFINPDKGIALGSPLSLFFSALYLKEFDDCFTACEVDYFRYHDDILIFCPTKRSFKRCQARLTRLLNQKHLSLSIKKTKMGRIEQGFHYLGIDYLGTQPLIKTSSLQEGKESTSMQLNSIFHENTLNKMRQDQIPRQLTVPHGRTLRRSREQVKLMVEDGVSHQKIRRYLSLWASWWQYADISWSKKNILEAWQHTCRDNSLLFYTRELSH